MAAAQKADDAVEALRNQLTGLINDRDAKKGTLSILTTRALSGMRGFFGPDSNQYDQAGGTRKSERNPPTRKAKA